MNYYKEIKNELINNEVYKRVKDYSKNRNELSTYYIRRVSGALVHDELAGLQGRRTHRRAAGVAAV